MGRQLFDGGDSTRNDDITGNSWLIYDYYKESLCDDQKFMFDDNVLLLYYTQFQFDDMKIKLDDKTLLIDQKES